MAKQKLPVGVDAVCSTCESTFRRKHCYQVYCGTECNPSEVRHQLAQQVRGDPGGLRAWFLSVRSWVDQPYEEKNG